MMKKVNLIVVLMSLLLLFTACRVNNREQSTSLLGVWVLSDMAGSDDAVRSMNYYEAMGWKVSMAISSDTLEMTTFDGSHSEYETVSYQIEGNKLITEASEMEFTLKDDTLSLTTNGVTMVFTRK